LETETYIASDILAFPKNCKSTVTLQSDEFAIIGDGTIKYFNKTGTVKKSPLPRRAGLSPVDKMGCTTFMEKEINEIPNIIENIIKSYRGNGDIAKFQKLISGCPCVHIVGCGTSYHAGLIIGALIEQKLHIRAKCHIASEFTADTIISDGEMAMVISQSGETADTISAIRVIKKKGLPVVALCNVATSTIAGASDICFPLLCGAEIAVASTKAFVSSVLIGTILVSGFDGLDELPDTAKKLIMGEKENILEQALTSFEFTADGQNNLGKALLTTKLINDEQKHISQKVQLPFDKIFFIGKGFDYFLSLESALKVNEVTYLHCEGFPAGELKHGTLSLVDERTLAVAYFTDDIGINAKINNAVMEISARGGRVVQLFKKSAERSPADFIIKIIPAQLFALQLSAELGIDPDKPRNLAKSVTVE
jgi:glucosamine--fructose-6-phosphate aminotransferase (isomerizing)